MSNHEKIDYVEFPSRNIEKTKAFFSAVFDWQFTDYGPDYISFSNEGVNGGFYQSDNTASTTTGSVLIVFYSNNLLETQGKIIEAGGEIIKAIFPFPGGSRFHFSDPNGNEYAVWSDVDA
jgi:predicted enzyme related to lactoylglutathione lyase